MATDIDFGTYEHICSLVYDYDGLFEIAKFIDVKKLTINDFYEIFMNRKITNSEKEVFFGKYLTLTKPFTYIESFESFVNILKENSFDIEKLLIYGENCRDFYSSVAGVDSTFFTFDNHQLMNFNTISLQGTSDHGVSFYGISRSEIYGVREYLFSNNEKKFNKICNDGSLDFNMQNLYYSEKFINQMLKKGNDDFIDGMVDVYGNRLEKLTMNNHEMSYVFEYFVNDSKYGDRTLFDYCDVSPNKIRLIKQNSLMNYWENSFYEIKSNSTGERIEYYPFLQDRSKLTKAIFLYVFDREMLKDRLKIKYYDKPQMYKLLKLIGLY
jgi:hypothetical protein